MVRSGKIRMVRRQISSYLPFNKRSNMIYMVNYNLVVNIFNIVDD